VDGWDDWPASRYRIRSTSYKPIVANSPFFFSTNNFAKYKEYFLNWNVNNIVCDEADNVCEGIFSWFCYHRWLGEVPPSWFFNPLQRREVSNSGHWSSEDEFEHDDIKIIWDLSRFSFVYTLVRAYVRSGDEKYSKIFWKLLEDWREKNPPNTWPNWKCGQEISFRIMAWCWGLYGFAASQESTPERNERLIQMIAVSGWRIEANLSYAISQHNNHSISEALGLYTIGLLFPQIKRSDVWKNKGRKWLERFVFDLIEEDGSFSQQSVVYHRLMLHDYIWVIRLAELNDEPFDDRVYDRLSLAATWLNGILDRDSGRAPLYGNSDGSLILPLSQGGYEDYRSVLQTSSYLFSKKKPLSAGPWDEELLWLLGEDAVQAQSSPSYIHGMDAQQGGYYSADLGDSKVFIRSGRHKSRPGQADLCHADVWWRGENIAVDAGTFSYNAPAPWDDPFGRTMFHNTVTVDGRDQMDRIGRFLWLPWLKGFGGPWIRGNTLTLWQGGHDGYERLKPSVRYRRAILMLPQDCILIFDFLSSQGNHTYRLHWLLANHPYNILGNGLLKFQIGQHEYYCNIDSDSISQKVTLVCGDDMSPRGWRSRYYWQKEPVLSLASEVIVNHSFFVTYFGPLQAHYDVDHSVFDAGSWRAICDIDRKSDEIKVVNLEGAFQERLAS